MARMSLDQSVLGPRPRQVKLASHFELNVTILYKLVLSTLD
jgi:hypothetical protein